MICHQGTPKSTHHSGCKHGPKLRPIAENGQNLIDVGVSLDWGSAKGLYNVLDNSLFSYYFILLLFRCLISLW